MTTAAADWRRQLEAWVLPEDLLAQAEESPYAWQKKTWKLRGEKALRGGDPTPTTELVHRLAAESASVLDIGAGTGRASLPLAKLGHPVTMVEPDSGMLEGLSELARGLPVQIVAGTWPDASGQVASSAVVMAAHVVYDVPYLAEFLNAMDRKAETAVVIEMFPEHPWSVLRELYWEFHRLERPLGPTGDDLLAVVRELGREPIVDKWSRPSDVSYETIDEMVAATARRLVLPRSRWSELEKYLSPRIVGEAGNLQLPPLEREIHTVWWRAADSL